MTSLRILGIFASTLGFSRAANLIIKIWRTGENGLSHALIALFGSICALNVWAIWVMLMVRRVRVDVIMGFLFVVTLQTYATEATDRELSKGNALD